MSRVWSPEVTLTRHTDTPCAYIWRITTQVCVTAQGQLSLKYVIEGDLTRVVLPDPCVPRRRDGLWQHTCCEAFLAQYRQPGYYEFNFSPSTEWAVYHFDAYRTGMEAVEPDEPPAILLCTYPQRLVLQATVRLSEWSTAPAGADWRLAVAAVIETAEGRRSYWALRHSPGPPDFHHPDGFALLLEANYND